MEKNPRDEEVIDFQEKLNYGTSKTNNKEFEENGYLVIKNIIDIQELVCEIPETRGMYNYYGSLENVSYNPVESQVPGSISRYRYPKYKYLHSEIRMKIENIIGNKLFNTYYFDRFYFVGQELKKHLDRPSCEISATVHISSNLTKCWPIYIKSPDVYGENKGDIIKKGKISKVCLNPGDAIIYKGCERPHWREPMKSKYNKIQLLIKKILGNEDDSYYHQVFFHYVLADGERCNFAGDMR